MAYRIISNSSTGTPTYAADTVDDLNIMLEKEKYMDEQGTAVIVLETSEVYMLDSKRTWIKI